MRIISDLHIHSRYSRACGKDISIENLEKYARIKGLNLLGTGDFTHPQWIEELKSKLTEDENGILWTKTKFPFIWQTEISLMYTEGGRGRRVHFVIFAPNGEVASQITDFLKRKGRVDYDGRPIFGFSAKELVDSLVKGISEKIIIIPAHIWTPYFGILGSKSGFDSIEEAFGERSKCIYAIETGMSSDPAMNWRLSSLDKYSILSFSDMHSYWPWRMGREATVFEMDELTYDNLFEAIKNQRIVSTIETDPGYGKYHFDGHMKCGVSLSPCETKRQKGICPVCKRPLTIGVMNRVEELADREEGFSDGKRPGFASLIPLSEVISGIIRSPVAGKKVSFEHERLISRFGNEIDVLLNAKEGDIASVSGKELARAIIDNREMRIKIVPGYDGEYGKPIFSDEDLKRPARKNPEPKKQGKDLTDFFK